MVSASVVAMSNTTTNGYPFHGMLPFLDLVDHQVAYPSLNLRRHLRFVKAGVSYLPLITQTHGSQCRVVYGLPGWNNTAKRLNELFGGA